MYSRKILLAAACLTVSGMASAAGAAPFDRNAPFDRDDGHAFDRGHDQDRDDHRGPRHDMHRPYVARERIYDTLRFHHYRGIGEPEFRHGHYVVRGMNRFGRSVFIEIDPYTGAFIGEFRI